MTDTTTTQQDQERKTSQTEFISDDFQTEFDLSYQTVPITLRKPNDPVPWECELREMDGFNRDMYLNTHKRRVNMRSQEVNDFQDVQTSLIAKCLFEKSTGKQVEAKAIREFPSKVQQKLYEICIKINGLGNEASKEAKND